MFILEWLRSLLCSDETLVAEREAHELTRGQLVKCQEQLQAADNAYKTTLDALQRERREKAKIMDELAETKVLLEDSHKLLDEALVALEKCQGQMDEPDIDILATATKTQVWKALADQLDDEGIVKAFMSDEQYGLTSGAEMAGFLAEDRTNKFEYVNDLYDCDDFSYRLMGNLSVGKAARLALGIMWVVMGDGQGHALNVFVDDKLTVWCIEPQTDQIFKKPADWRVSVVMM